MISFFFGNSGAGEIRGRQMAAYLGARMNPKEGFEDDVCIYVKQAPPTNSPKITYVDIIDGVGLIEYLKHATCGVISTSLTGQKYLRDTLKRDVIFIPENHCNYNNETRPPREVNVVGVIGNMKGFNIDLDKAESEIRKLGMKLKLCDDYQTRQDVIDFYKSIDLQLCWRPHVGGAHAQLHNPLKLANACSFGIPTIAFPEDNFRAEFEGAFMPVYTIDELWAFVKDMRDTPRLYDYLAKEGIKRAKNYHISEVAKLYLNLGG